MTGAIAATLAGQQAAEALMIGTCIITREDPANPGTFDPSTGETPATHVTVYSGKCKLRQPSPTDRAQDSGSFDWSLQDSILSLPITATGIRRKDMVEITGSPLSSSDVGTRHSIEFIPRGTFVTARRFVVREAP